MSTTYPIRRTVSVGVAGALSVLALAVVPAQSAPATPPSEGRIAFARGGGSGIWSMAADGSDKRRLTSGLVLEKDPVWSSDGKRIAFTRQDAELWVMNANGTSPSQIELPTAVTRVDDPDWSPDGTRLVFGCQVVTASEICIVSLDDGVIDQLTNDDVFDSDPTWSPDGTKIAFQRGFGSSAGEGVHVMDVDGTNVVRLADGQMPAWSPDGKKIAFVNDLEVYSMDANGSNVLRLTENGDMDLRPTWSPEGTKIVFESNREGAADWQLYIMNANGTSETKLTDAVSDGFFNGLPDFSPDLTPPSLSITSPADEALLTNETFEVKGAASDGASGVDAVEVKVDGGSFVAAAGTTSWSLEVTTSQGPHTVTVRTTDKAGNVREKSIEVHVDSEAPETMIVSAKDHQRKQIKRSGKTASTSITFELTASDNFPEIGGGVALECRLDGQAFAPCASTIAYTLLTKGPHTFEARAVDGSGNVDPTPAIFTWTVTTKAVK